MPSWKPQVIADSSGKWAENSLRFATKEEAEASARSLAYRWTLVTDHRAVESDDAPNYKFEDGREVRIATG